MYYGGTSHMCNYQYFLQIGSCNKIKWLGANCQQLKAWPMLHLFVMLPFFAEVSMRIINCYTIQNYFNCWNLFNFIERFIGILFLWWRHYTLFIYLWQLKCSKLWIKIEKENAICRLLKLNLRFMSLNVGLIKKKFPECFLEDARLNFILFL